MNILQIPRDHVLNVGRVSEIQQIDNNLYINGYIASDDIEWTDDELLIRNVDNAGGDSILSETVSYCILKHIYGDSFYIYKTENQLATRSCSRLPICDYICSINDRRIGVSVTRFLLGTSRYRRQSIGIYSSYREAYCLLQRKFNGLVNAHNCSDEKWHSGVLHVWCYSKIGLDILTIAWRNLTNDQEFIERIRGNDLLITCTFGDTRNEFIYSSYKNPIIYL